jgi:hypothetical protein
MSVLENIHIGPFDQKPENWRDRPDDSPDDDEEIDTPNDVVRILGFNPLDEQGFDDSPSTDTEPEETKL